MTGKKIIGQVHLWLGLFSGVIVFIVALTGTLLVFETEIKSLFPKIPEAPSRFVQVQNKPYLKPSQLSELLRKKYPSVEPWGIDYHYGHTAYAFGGVNDEQVIVHFNPYTGEEIRVEEYKERMRDVDHVFDFILAGHLHLWIPHETGKHLVGFGTLIFLFMLISGIILWWPKNKAAAKQRFRFQWKPSTKWRRKNYDVHNILGFYMTWIALFLAITGLVMAFDWFRNGTYYTFSGEMPEVSFQKPVSYKPIAGDHLDRIWEGFQKQNPDFTGSIQMFYSVPEGEPISYHCTECDKEEEHFNPYTLEPISDRNPVANAILGANYSIHVGSILGLPTKILAFFASLIAASLPITGFYIWFGRRKKEKKV